MGLDMYLYAETYISSYGNDDKLAHQAIVLALQERYGKVQSPERGFNVRMTVGYWRKANHIHEWFVQNVQEGTDDCGTYLVSRSHLEALHEACVEVLKGWSDPEIREEIAASYLPTSDGFFFGNTDYDLYYKDSVEETRDKLRELLGNTELEDADFYYSSSW